MYVVADDPGRGAGELSLVAMGQGRARGMATAVLDPSTRKSHLVAVVVQPEARGRGIGNGLLEGLELESKRRGMQEIHTTLETDRPSRDTLARLLVKRAWAEPIAAMYHCKARYASELLEAPEWKGALPEDAEIFGWPDLHEQERAELSAEQLRGPWFPMALAPFPDKPIEPRVSVGVRKNGAVAGWVLAHRTGPDSVMYSRLVIREEERRNRLATRLLAEAIRRQGAAGIEVGEFAVRSDNRPMLGFLQSRLAPFVFEQAEIRYLEKRL